MRKIGHFTTKRCRFGMNGEFRGPNLSSLAVPVLLHPQELFQVRAEQRSRRAELSPEFPFALFITELCDLCKQDTCL